MSARIDLAVARSGLDTRDLLRDRTKMVQTPAEKAFARSGLSLLRLEHLSGIPRSALRRCMADPRRFTLSDLHSFAEATGGDGAQLFTEITKPN